MKIGWPNENINNPIQYSSAGPYWIFDLDGVLVELSPLRYALWEKKDYKEHNRIGCFENGIDMMIRLANSLHDSGNRIIISTGRDGLFLSETADQLDRLHVNYSLLYMRNPNSKLPSPEEKRNDFLSIQKHFPRLVPVCAVDDRRDVTRMWNELDIPTLIYPSLATSKE